MKTKTLGNKPLFVVISDVHYSLANLELSDRAFRAAIDKAAELGVPLVDAGDITNDKAILRGEVINRIIETLEYAIVKAVDVLLLVGNHSLVNERGEEHVLNFLRPYAHVIDHACKYEEILPGVTLIPYQNDIAKFKAALKQKASKGDIVVMHQGVQGALMGDYVQDKTAIDRQILAPYTCISGHYHKHQTIGTLTYVGNPFTMSFGEAHDGPKGFLIVNTDGSFTREILDLRKHVIIETEIDDSGAMSTPKEPAPNDLVWVKVRGPATALDTLKKKDLSVIIGHSNFKLDKIVTQAGELKTAKPLTDNQTLDALIDKLGETPEQRQKLKALWRELIA